MNDHLRRFGLAALACGAVGLVPAAQATGYYDYEQHKLQVMRDNGLLNPQQYDMLKQQLEREHSKATASRSSGSGLNLGTKGGLSIKSDDGNFSAEFGGRIQVDAASISDDATNLDPGSGTEFRRARLYAKGTLYKDWAFKSQIDFAGNEVTLKDMYIQHKPSNITIGQHKMPFSLEELTSSKYITFMERALPNVFATGRRIGASWGTHNDLMSLTVAGYGQEEGGDEDEEGFGAGARLTFAPVNSNGNVLHLGAAGAWENAPDAADDKLRLRQRPEAHITERMVSTGQLMNVDDFTKYGAELAAVFGPLSLQGEYMMADVKRTDGLDDVEFDGWYAFLSWFLTGESRPYDASKGVFGRVKPKQNFGQGGPGAWELAFRYSELDLNDGDDARVDGALEPLSGGVWGGEMENFTVGVNWYINPMMRVMFNYINVDSKRPTLGAMVGPDTYEVATFSDDPEIFQVRFQADWK